GSTTPRAPPAGKEVTAVLAEPRSSRVYPSRTWHGHLTGRYLSAVQRSPDRPASCHDHRPPVRISSPGVGVVRPGWLPVGSHTAVTSLFVPELAATQALASVTCRASARSAPILANLAGTGCGRG